MRRSWWPLAAVAILLVLAGGAAAVASPQLTHLPLPRSTGAPPEPSFEPLPTAPSSPVQARGERAADMSVPGWLGPLLTTLMGVVVAGGLLVGLWLVAGGRMRSRAGRLDAPGAGATMAREAAAGQVVAAVDAGLSELSDADLDPRRAVIACWVRLEEIAARAGTPRQAADTSTDLVTRLLAAHQVDLMTLAAFAAVYRQARYATRDVDEQMRGQARAALEQIRSALIGTAV